MVLFSLACFLFYLRVLCFICVVPFLFACFVFYLRGSFFICVVSFMLLCFADMGHRTFANTDEIRSTAEQDSRRLKF